MQALNKIGALLRVPLSVPDIEFVHNVFESLGLPGSSVTSIRKTQGGFVIRTSLKDLPAHVPVKLPAKFRASSMNIEIAIRGFRFNFKF